MCAVVNQIFVNRFLHGESPIGRKLGGPGHTFPIVGVARDNKYTGVTEDPMPMTWFGWRQMTPA